MTRLDTMTCSVARSLDVIGEWWTILIVREALFGVTRFEHFHNRLGIARTVLSARLDHLVGNNILTRHQYSDRPPRAEYLLTEKGRDLYGVVLALISWGDRWSADESGPPVEVVHDSCGRPVDLGPACAHCATIIAPHSLAFRPLLPGAPGPIKR